MKIYDIIEDKEAFSFDLFSIVQQMSIFILINNKDTSLNSLLDDISDKSGYDLSGLNDNEIKDLFKDTGLNNHIDFNKRMVTPGVSDTDHIDLPDPENSSEIVSRAATRAATGE